ncbi:MAG: hypothetical protein EYC70_09950 [Planctomycetota bacterium]|nr:MAG: hypothetical protein EYC70_09950 [Planctomycetota bacterium]
MISALIAFVATLPAQDYDGDGFADLAIGVSYEDGPGGAFDAGAINVLYGSAVGLKAAGSQLWSQNSPGVGGQAESADHFGRVMSWGDFDADGYDDLLIGVGQEDIGPLPGAGFVHVMYGSPAGLSSLRNQLWAQEDLGLGEYSEQYDNFGFDVMRGDFNGDGFDDAAIAARKEDLGPVENAGAVYVLYGGPTGLNAAGSQAWNQDSPGIVGHTGQRDEFGTALASGDFNGDGRSDLAIGILQEAMDSGGVHILYGSPGGLAAPGNQLWTQHRRFVPGNPELNDEWGTALAAGDFNGDGADDLAIGVPLEGRAAVVDCGAVTLLYGSPAGLQTHRAEIWSQNSPGVHGVAEDADQFGAELLAGDWNMDGIDDLFVAVLQESYAGANSAGAVQVLLGSPAGITATDNFLISQGSHGLANLPEDGDYFGHGMALGDFDGNGFADFAIGAPREDIGNDINVGIVHVIYSRAVRRVQEWTQDSPGIPGEAESSDFFGRSFAR